jgi:hypothetical protein
VVRPVDADVVNLVLAVAELHNTVDDAPRVGGQRSFRCLWVQKLRRVRPRTSALPFVPIVLAASTDVAQIV